LPVLTSDRHELVYSRGGRLDASHGHYRSSTPPGADFDRIRSADRVRYHRTDAIHATTSMVRGGLEISATPPRTRVSTAFRPSALSHVMIQWMAADSIARLPTIPSISAFLRGPGLLSVRSRSVGDITCRRVIGRRRGDLPWRRPRRSRRRTSRAADASAYARTSR
jgi:hypothetical protein